MCERERVHLMSITPAPEVAPHNVEVVRSEDDLSMQVSFQRLSLVEAKRVTLYYLVSYILLISWVWQEEAEWRGSGEGP